MSFYKTIYETVYNKRLIDLAEELTKGQGDGRISYDDVESLCNAVKDGVGFKERGITNNEVETLKHIYKNYKLTSESAKIKLLEFILFQT